MDGMPSLVVAATDSKHPVPQTQIVLRKHVARCCPARRLPVELWDIIFENCVPSTPGPSLVEAPLNVSQVCRSWRDIALSHSVLWSTLAINTNCSHTEGSYALETLRDIIQLWLGRSVTRLLSVSLTQSGEDKSTGGMSFLLEAVLAHTTNLRGLEVRAPETCLGPLASPALYLPELEHLKIESPWPALSNAAFLLPLDRVPRLRSLAALHISFDAAHISVFDYRQLTELTLLPDVHAPASVCWTADEALTFLADAPKLRTLRVAVSDRSPRRGTFVQADALHSLSLHFYDARFTFPRRHVRIGGFFALLCTPNLQQLAVRDCGLDNPDVWPPEQFLGIWPVKEFLVYLRATQLRVLKLKHLPLYQTQVVECLQQLPQLMELVIEARAHRGMQHSVGDFLLMALTKFQPPADFEPIATALRSVEFRNCGARCREPELLKMFNSRCALKYLRLHRAALPSEELVGRIASWNPVVCGCGCAQLRGYSIVLARP
ncbi:hypothetical protein DFH06DRAFT_1315477 [Mycena polygramma]|nr:hypothetical protein DFH06DRAFT_1315477 [Mycena polygramma]